MLEGRTDAKAWRWVKRLLSSAGRGQCLGTESPLRLPGFRLWLMPMVSVGENKHFRDRNPRGMQTSVLPRAGGGKVQKLTDGETFINRRFHKFPGKYH